MYSISSKQEAVLAAIVQLHQFQLQQRWAHPRIQGELYSLTGTMNDIHVNLGGSIVRFLFLYRYLFIHFTDYFIHFRSPSTFRHTRLPSPPIRPQS